MTITSLVRDVFKRLSTASFIEVTPETRDELAKYLEEAPTMLLRGLARRIRINETIVINVTEDDDQ